MASQAALKVVGVKASAGSTPVSPANSRKDYLRNYQRKWVAERRAEFFKDKVCIKCGPTARLELDHIDPSTKVSHNIWSWNENRRAAELAKCQVLCYKCHKAKSVVETAKLQRKVGSAGESWCAGCQVFLPISKFHSNTSRWNKLAQDCKDCANEPSRRGRESQLRQLTSLEH